MALVSRSYVTSIIHHSDRGLQYSSEIYTDLLRANDFLIRTTQTASPYENAVAERINVILKTEFNIEESSAPLEQTRLLVAESIQLYNTLRPHLSCQFLTSNQMHQHNQVKIKIYKRKKSETQRTPIQPKIKL